MLASSLSPSLFTSPICYLPACLGKYDDMNIGSIAIYMASSNPAASPAEVLELSRGRLACLKALVVSDRAKRKRPAACLGEVEEEEEPPAKRLSRMGMVDWKDIQGSQISRAATPEEWAVCRQPPDGHMSLNLQVMNDIWACWCALFFELQLVSCFLSQ